MIITETEYTLLKTIADDVMVSGSYHPSYKRFLKTVVQENKIVDSFHKDGTRAAILVGLLRAVENGLEPISDVMDKPLTIEEITQEPETIDEFTAEALAKIAPGGPDSQILNPPHDKIEVGLVDVPARKRKKAEG